MKPIQIKKGKKNTFRGTEKILTNIKNKQHKIKKTPNYIIYK